MREVEISIFMEGYLICYIKKNNYILFLTFVIAESCRAVSSLEEQRDVQPRRNTKSLVIFPKAESPLMMLIFITLDSWGLYCNLKWRHDMRERAPT